MDDNNIDEIKKYMEEMGYAQEEGKDNLFSIGFSVGHNGTVDVTIQWPEEFTENLTECASTLLYSINEGLLKKMTVDAVTDSYNKYPEIKKEVEQIVEKWLILQSSSADGPCIKPTETLRGS
tara:strand:- start:95 stop:460 length:366 start_codon:yes stop_codon:yes gene_type:complete